MDTPTFKDGKPVLLKDCPTRELWIKDKTGNVETFYYPEKEKEQMNEVKLLEEKYPGMTSEFKRIQQEQYELFCRKQLSYGPSNIAMGTDLSKDEDIQLSSTALVIRMNDKVNRLINLVIKQNRDDANEPIKDSFLDVSNYGIMAEVVRRGEWGK